MTDAELSVLERLAKEATPGPVGFTEYKSSGIYGHTENLAIFYAAANPDKILSLIAELPDAERAGLVGEGSSDYHWFKKQ